MLTVVCLAVLAACMFAVASTAQQRAARRTILSDQSSVTPEGPVGLAVRSRVTLVRQLAFRALGMFRRLLRNRLWLAGWLANVTGFLIQAAALHFGSLAVVQPLLVTQLVFALVFTTVGTSRRPQFRDLAGAAAICGGLASLLSVHGAAPLSGMPDRMRVVVAIGIAVALTALLSSIAATCPSALRPAVLGIAAGQFFALSAALVKLTTDDLVHRGVGATATDWPGYTLALTTVLGLLLEQSAYASGPLPSALSAMTIVNPVASYLLGIFAVGIPAPTSPGALAAVGAAAVLLVLGIITLARSPSTHLIDELAIRNETSPLRTAAGPG